MINLRDKVATWTSELKLMKDHEEDGELIYGKKKALLAVRDVFAAFFGIQKNF